MVGVGVAPAVSCASAGGAQFHLDVNSRRGRLFRRTQRGARPAEGSRSRREPAAASIRKTDAAAHYFGAPGRIDEWRRVTVAFALGGAGRRIMAKVRETWIEASDVIPMFPTLVWQASLKPQLRDAINASILRALDSLRRDLSPLAPGMGWQSEQTLHQREELGRLVPCVGDLARSVLRFLRIGYDAVEITGCWATVLAKGAAHRAHTHPNNFLSAVYYVRAEPGADAINFHDPRAQAGVIRPPVVELTSANTDQVVVKVASGTLLMFPSYLEHSVDANPGEHERVSVSFNLMFASFARGISKPLW